MSKKGITGARRWRQLAVKRADMLHEMKAELIALALLACDEPAFYSLQDIAKAKQIRDRVLAEYRSP